jgi:hypothetical protein
MSFQVQVINAVREICVNELRTVMHGDAKLATAADDALGNVNVYNN